MSKIKVSAGHTSSQALGKSPSCLLLVSQLPTILGIPWLAAASLPWSPHGIPSCVSVRVSSPLLIRTPTILDLLLSLLQYDLLLTNSICKDFISKYDHILRFWEGHQFWGEDITQPRYIFILYITYIYIYNLNIYIYLINISIEQITYLTKI